MQWSSTEIAVVMSTVLFTSLIMVLVSFAIHNWRKKQKESQELVSESD